MSKPMRALRHLVPLLCLGLMSLTAGAHDMHMKMASQAALGASATFDTQGRLWLVSVRDGHVQLQHSDNLGNTLSKPAVVNPVAETIYATGENRPKVAIGAAGQIYVAWAEQPSPGWTGYIRFARSTDGGAHFSPRITINHDLAKVTRGFDSLEVARNGDLMVAWIDARDNAKAKAAGKPYAGFAFYYSWSTDGGKTFATERKLMDHSCECCRTALAPEADGKVAAFFRGVYGDNIRDHAFAVLHTGGHANAPHRATFSHWQVAACPDQGPGLAIGANGLRHAVWYEASHGPAIWYGQLDPGHPPHHKLKIGGPGASHADVIVLGTTVWVTWNQVSATGYTLMLRTSRDSGAHFGKGRAIATSKVTAGSPQLLTRGAAAYVGWNTTGGFRLISAGEH